MLLFFWQTDLDLAGMSLIFCIFGHLILKRRIRINERDIQFLDAGRQMHFAEVRLHIDAVNVDRHLLNIARQQLHFGSFIRTIDSFRSDSHGFSRQTSNLLLGLVMLIAGLDFTILLQRFLELCQLVFQRIANHVLSATGLRLIGIFRDQLPPLSNRFLVFFLRVVNLAETEQHTSIALIQGIFGEKLRPQGACLSKIFLRVCLLGFGEFRVDNLPLHDTPGTVGRIGLEKIFPRLQCRIKVVLLSQGFAQVVHCLGALRSLLILFVGQHRTVTACRVFISPERLITLANP